MSTLANRTDDILARWLQGVSNALGEHGCANELLEGYRALARFVLEHGLDANPEVPPGAELDGLIAMVARTSRRAGQSISSTLARFGDLPDIVASLASPEDGSEKRVEALRAARRVDSALDLSMRRLVRALEETEIRAQRERAEAMTAMMEVLSHELDNRLGAARTATDMLDNPRIALDDEGLQRVGRLVRSSLDDALKTVDDVESLIRSWGEERADDGGGIPLPILIRNLVEDLRPTAEDERVRLEVVGDRIDVPVDGARLRLVLYNLVSNGIRYHDPAKEDRWVRIETEKLDDGRLRLRVVDNGIGISPDEHDSIFLYRARVDDEIDGSGLGLAIVREAVEQLGGDLDVDSRPGEGATFTVTFSS